MISCRCFQSPLARTRTMAASSVDTCSFGSVHPPTQATASEFPLQRANLPVPRPFMASRSVCASRGHTPRAGREHATRGSGKRVSSRARMHRTTNTLASIASQLHRTTKPRPCRAASAAQRNREAKLDKSGDCSDCSLRRQWTGARHSALEPTYPAGRIGVELGVALDGSGRH
jgi:hypothetical protein